MLKFCGGSLENHYHVLGVYSFKSYSMEYNARCLVTALALLPSLRIQSLCDRRECAATQSSPLSSLLAVQVSIFTITMVLMKFHLDRYLPFQYLVCRIVMQLHYISFTLLYSAIIYVPYYKYSKRTTGVDYIYLGY